ncbi:Crp/Fnr family transcriptional regulator [Legionella londiniensis]|uniref:cNMP binding domain-containing protein n=1 Tax=Legionella londiniensis TaxID=45068 RepID=A0A0W0VMY1_9GAMM|nr:cyclic nucleotide-binding domain-containing protein [Legionella londiniensis]KTD21277.1 cNMP binding domain-containing protein [Legionella londiniensis]STX93303.1 cNMP binding domain-containing protein [Legionella londiniensis]
MNINTNITESLIEEVQATKLGRLLTRDELNRILAHSEVQYYPVDCVIYKQGKVSHGLYILLSGKANIFARTMGDKIAKIDIRKAGEFLGEICFIDKEPSRTYAIAKSPCKCLFISSGYTELLRFYYPETKYKILKAISIQLCQRIKSMHDKVNEFILESDMVSLSLFGRVIHSLTHAKEMTFSQSGINEEQLLQKVLFQHFSDDEVGELLHHASILQAPKNYILIHEQEKSACCYIVLNGAVQSSIMQDNKLAKLSVIGPNLLFASIGCIDKDSKFTITFITCEKATLLKIPEKQLEYFKQQKPELWYKLFELICESIVALGKSIDKLDVRLHIELYNR